MHPDAARRVPGPRVRFAHGLRLAQRHPREAARVARFWRRATGMTLDASMG